MERRNHTPTYRLHKSSRQGIVTLTDAVSGLRKDILLGTYNTKASRVEYARVLAEQEARERLLENATSSDLAIDQLLREFIKHAGYYLGRKRRSWRKRLRQNSCMSRISRKVL